MSTPGPNAQNPYAPPAARVQDVAETTGPGSLADRGTRLGAFIIDALILGLVEGPVLWFGIGRLMNLAAAGGTDFNDRLTLLRTFYVGNPGMPFTGLLFLLWAIITIVFVSRYGQSIGKRILGIKVVRTDGSKA